MPVVSIRPEDLIGCRLGPYTVDRLIGRGGMGTVYQGRAGGAGAPVALKVLLPEATRDRETVLRFRREAQVLARIRHPHVVRVYRFARAGSLWYLAQEFVDGADYERLVEEQGPLPLPEALDVADAVAAALEAVHAEGIIHRDLKPSNVMRRRDGVIKVLDFGIAKPLEGGPAVDITRSGVFLGTLGYCAPEQIRGERLTVRSDLYSLGALLFFLLTGEPPHRGRETEEVVAATLRGRVPGLKRRLRGRGDAALRLLASLLHNQPGRRPATAAEARAAIAAARRRAAVSRPGFWARLRSWWGGGSRPEARP